MKEYANEDFYEPAPYVCVDGEFIPCDNVEIENIEEDFCGRDLVTFNYQGEYKKSYVTLR